MPELRRRHAEILKELIKVMNARAERAEHNGDFSEVEELRAQIRAREIELEILSDPTVAKALDH